MARPNPKYPAVEQIEVINGAGPWDTKSGGQLEVLFQLSLEVIQKKYFNYDHEELKNLSSDIRGLRAYTVSNIAKGSIGANEWHKLRSELVFVLRGSAKWTCQDLAGAKKTFILRSGRGVYTPPFILHTYEALESDTSLLVLANTLFDANNKLTQDTYTFEDFQRYSL